MLPPITQAMAMERTNEIRTAVASSARASQLRRARHVQCVRLSPGVSGAGQGPDYLPARQSLRDPRAA
jgi:hypothetical protein